MSKPYDLKTAARMLGISTPMLRKLRDTQQIGHYRIGTKTTFSEQHIADYLARVEVKAKSEPARVGRHTSLEEILEACRN